MMNKREISNIVKKCALCAKIGHISTVLILIGILVTLIGTIVSGIQLLPFILAISCAPAIPSLIVEFILSLQTGDKFYNFTTTKNNFDDYYEYSDVKDIINQSKIIYHLNKDFEITSIEDFEKLNNNKCCKRNNLGDYDNCKSGNLLNYSKNSFREHDYRTLSSRNSLNKKHSRNRAQQPENNLFLIDEATGREKEIQNLIQALALMNKSVIIVGEPGVGKTALVNGLEYKIQNKQVPDFLKGKKIIRKNAAELISNTKYSGQLEVKILNLVQSIKGKDCILFIDEIHNLIGGGRADDSTIDIANILKPYLSNGDIKLIGATTEKEYNKYILRDSAFSRRFEKIIIKEPNNDALKKIIAEQIKNNEYKYKIKFDFTSIEKQAIINILVELTDSKHRDYKDYKYNPALVLSILERAFANSLVNNSKVVTKKDILDAINCCDDVYGSCKNRISNEIETTLDTEKSKIKCKTLSFNNHYNKNS